MNALRYFPLHHDSPSFSMGVKALAAAEPLLETTENYWEELRLKQRLLDEAPSRYTELPLSSIPAQREACDYLLSRSHDVLAKQPQLATQIAADTVAPLLVLSRRIQEDLVLLDATTAGCPIVAGVVCFPSGWSIDEKAGQSISEVHEPVPGFQAQLGAATMRLLEQLKAARPVWRMNWGVRPSKELDQSPPRLAAVQMAASQLCHDSTTDLSQVGARCVLRVERQTLSKLPETQTILFTIHTHQCLLQELSIEQLGILHDVLQRCEPEQLRYKGIAAFSTPLMQYLSARLD